MFFLCFINKCILFSQIIDDVLKKSQLKRIPVARDGFCIISAWRYALNNCGHVNLSINEMITALRREISRNVAICSPWVTGNIVKQVL